jgi:hypothetical protein
LTAGLVEKVLLSLVIVVQAYVVGVFLIFFECVAVSVEVTILGEAAGLFYGFCCWLVTVRREQIGAGFLHASGWSPNDTRLFLDCSSSDTPHFKSYTLVLRRW